VTNRSEVQPEPKHSGAAGNPEANRLPRRPKLKAEGMRWTS